MFENWKKNRKRHQPLQVGRKIRLIKEIELCAEKGTNQTTIAMYITDIFNGNKKEKYSVDIVAIYDNGIEQFDSHYQTLVCESEAAALKLYDFLCENKGVIGRTTVKEQSFIDNAKVLS